jgi:hypothetical protein
MTVAPPPLTTFVSVSENAARGLRTPRGMYSRVQTGMPKSLRLGRLRKRESPFFFCTVHWALFYRRQRGVELFTEIESTNKKSLFFSTQQINSKY